MLLFYLFSRHNMAPGKFYALQPGERMLINAFCEHEIDIKG